MQTEFYFEDLVPGEAVESSAHTITEADINAFADLSGDRNPLHIDAAYAATTPFGERIAHGMLVLSIATGLANSIGALASATEAFTGLEWKFRAPVKIGDTIRVRLTVFKKRTMMDYHGGLVTFKVLVLNQRDETVQKGSWTLLVRAR